MSARLRHAALQGLWFAAFYAVLVLVSSPGGNRAHVLALTPLAWLVAFASDHFRRNPRRRARDAELRNRPRYQ